VIKPKLIKRGSSIEIDKDMKVIKPSLPIYGEQLNKTKDVIATKESFYGSAYRTFVNNQNTDSVS
jgi:hypothetical protein